MGFYPKRLRRKAFLSAQRTVAHAALAGATFKPERVPRSVLREGDITVWTLIHPDRHVTRFFKSKHQAAVVYLNNLPAHIAVDEL